MSVLTERQSDILHAVVAEYIRNGEPVSSADIRERYRFSFSPATIRNEFLYLTDAGYLAQPHTSAGRIPTDSGYRWYVDRLDQRRKQAGKPNIERSRKDSVESLDSYKDADDFFRRATELLAEITHGLAIGGAIARTDEPLYKSGFAEILGDSEFFEPESRNFFGELVDSIDTEMREFARSHELMTPQVFIGDENPIRQARRYSMLARRISRDGTIGIIAIIGPKRMRYEKALGVLRALGENSWD